MEPLALPRLLTMKPDKLTSWNAADSSFRASTGITMPQIPTQMDPETATALNELKEHTRNRREDWSIFLGAGATAALRYPTMVVLVNTLRDSLDATKPEDNLISKVISALTEACARSGRSLNIEEVLRDLYQLVDMMEGKPALKISYGGA